MSAESIVIGIVFLVGVAATGYLIRPSRLRRLALEKARTAVAAAAPLTARSGLPRPRFGDGSTGIRATGGGRSRAGSADA